MKQWKYRTQKKIAQCLRFFLGLSVFHGSIHGYRPWFMFLIISVMTDIKKTQPAGRWHKTIADSTKMYSLPTNPTLTNQPGKQPLLLISINFTPKNSHSCPKKMVLPGTPIRQPAEPVPLVQVWSHVSDLPWGSRFQMVPSWKQGPLVL